MARATHPGTPRARNADATRAALLEAATKRFTVLGYERTTTRDIAADAGANVSLIARYFGSKEGLFAAVLQESTDALERFRGLGDVDLATSIVDGLAADRWPEFGGEHPLLLLVRGADDDIVGDLRQRSLAEIVAYLGERVSGPTPASDSPASDPPASDSPASETPALDPHDADDVALRGDVALAVVVGLLTVRSARPDGPLARADETRLRALTERLVTAIAASD